MPLWQLDIVGGVWLVNPATGVLREVKVVTGVDDHSRFCVIATVVERATGRAVCLALAAALARFGVPGEILTDNGKQFTARFGRGGEVLFDKICRHNGITHRLTQPASPTTTGKIERFHLTLRRELLDDHEPFASLAAAQAAVDEFVRVYNTERPHQALDGQRPVSPADRFTPTNPTEAELVPLWLPPTITPAPAPTTSVPTGYQPDSDSAATPPGPERSGAGGAVEFDRVVPPAGNMQLAGRQLWLGPARSGQVVRFWADTTLIHPFIGGTRVKTRHDERTQRTSSGCLVRGRVVVQCPQDLHLDFGQRYSEMLAHLITEGKVDTYA